MLISSKLYTWPRRNLCSERQRDWQIKFASLNLKCAELTGDTDQAQLRFVQHASIIITTPEKWDSMTRKWKDHARLMQMVKLFLIDEVHILKDPRGATLEAVVSRMKSTGSKVRFLALSATVPNSEDIAVWLGKDYENQCLPARLEVFGEEFRPVKLQKHVYGLRYGGNDFGFEGICDPVSVVLFAISTFPVVLLIHSQFTRDHCEPFQGETHHDILHDTEINDCYSKAAIQSVAVGKPSGSSMACSESKGTRTGPGTEK